MMTRKCFGKKLRRQVRFEARTGQAGGYRRCYSAPTDLKGMHWLQSGSQKRLHGTPREAWA